MSLIASSISSTFRFLARQSKELYTVVGGYLGQLQGQPSPAGEAPTEVPEVAVVTEVK